MPFVVQLLLIELAWQRIFRGKIVDRGSALETIIPSSFSPPSCCRYLQPMRNDSTWIHVGFIGSESLLKAAKEIHFFPYQCNYSFLESINHSFMISRRSRNNRAFRIFRQENLLVFCEGYRRSLSFKFREILHFYFSHPPLSKMDIVNSPFRFFFLLFFFFIFSFLSASSPCVNKV